VLRAATSRRNLVLLEHLDRRGLCRREHRAERYGKPDTSANTSANRRMADGRRYVTNLPPEVVCVCSLAVIRILPLPLRRANARLWKHVLVGRILRMASLEPSRASESSVSRMASEGPVPP
jgi:hypothetical protein